jgi:ATP-binding cassette subfamily C (CFTR/MRP) protein 1
VYSRKPVVLLDDIFSGLDPITEETIFQSLFGNNGLLRRGSQTVVLATHAVHFLSAVDHVILLGESSEVVYQGSYSNLPRNLVSMRDLQQQQSPSSDSDFREKISMASHVAIVASEDFIPALHPLATDIDTASPDFTRQTGDATIYRYYLSTMGTKHVLLFVVLGAMCMGFTPAQSLWLNAWANDPNASTKIPLYLGIYGIFFVGEVALTTLWIWYVYKETGELRYVDTG